MTEKQDVQIISVGKVGVQDEVALILSRFWMKAFGFMLVLVLASIIILVRSGLSIRSLSLLVGPLLSLVGLIGFVNVVIGRAAAGAPERGWLPMLGAAGGYLPYLFGCYLFFYEGLWQIILQFKSFSLM